MFFFIRFIIFFLGLLPLAVFCQSAQAQKRQQEELLLRQQQLLAEQEQLKQKKIDDEAWRAGVKNIYSEYKRLQTEFEIKGSVSGREVYYSGALTSIRQEGKQVEIRITLRDAIFQSNLFALVIKGNTLEEINYLQDTKNTYSLDRYHWVEVFGRVFELKFFLPLMVGFVPDEFFMPQTTIEEEGQKAAFRSGDFDSIGKFKDHKLQSIHYRSDGEREVINILLIGDKKLQGKRSFPQALHINRSRSEKDFLRMNFQRVNLVLH